MSEECTARVMWGALALVALLGSVSSLAQMAATRPTQGT